MFLILLKIDAEAYILEDCWYLSGGFSFLFRPILENALMSSLLAPLKQTVHYKIME